MLVFPYKSYKIRCIWCVYSIVHDILCVCGQYLTVSISLLSFLVNYANTGHIRDQLFTLIQTENKTSYQPCTLPQLGPPLLLLKHKSFIHLIADI